MSEVFLRPLEAMSALRQVVADNDEQRDAHWAEVPEAIVRKAAGPAWRVICSRTIPRLLKTPCASTYAVCRMTSMLTARMPHT